MKKIKLIGILILLIGFASNAQKVKFGKVSKEELEEKVYSLDSSANACYLYRKKRTYFDLKKTFNVVTEVHEKIKIYTQEGFHNATHKIAFYSLNNSSSERITGLKANTYNLVDGKIEKTKLSKKEIFKEVKNRYWSFKKFTLPNIKEGCIIEFKYKILTPFWNVKDLSFQAHIPTKRLKYTVEIPEYFQFNKVSKGHFSINPIVTTNTGGVFALAPDQRTSITTYNGKNIEALKDDEPFVNNINNYRGGIKYELSATNFPNQRIKTFSQSWEDVAREIYENPSFGLELKKRNYFESDLQTILANTTTAPEKVSKILELVKSKIKWNDMKGKYTEFGVKKAYKDGLGNVADINLTLVAMLQEAGFNANPVLISTRNHGISLFPTREGFNYVIASIKNADNSLTLLDATDKYSTPNNLPIRTINGFGRLITKEGNSSSIDLTPKQYAIEKNVLNITFDKDFQAKGVLTSNFKKLRALNYRNNYNTLEEEVHISKLEDLYKIEINELKISNQEDNLSKPITHSIEFENNDFVEPINNKTYINSLLFLKTSKNPFKLKDRKFPIDFVSPWREINQTQLTIPDGYAIESIPSAMSIGISDAIGSFKFQVVQSGNTLKIVSDLKFNKGIILSKYYQEIKEFYKQIIEKQAEKIVLVKK